MPFPKIIFCENHLDPSAVVVMNSLVPELKQLGYEVMHIELPASMTDEDFLNDIENQEKNNIENREKLNENMVQLASLEMNQRSLHKSLIQNLRNNQIEYRCVDIGINPHQDINYYTSKKGMKKRDKRMTKAYLKEERPVFGLVGLKHAKGMQEKILEQLPKEEASNLFYFVYIHNYKEAPKSKYEPKDENHPLGLHRFYANEMDEKEIAANIIKQINAMAEQNSKSPKEPKDEQAPQKIPSQKKSELLDDIRKTFGDNGEYKNSYSSFTDKQGEKYRKELLDFIDKPQYCDVIIDKLERLGRKAQKDLEQHDLYSFFKYVHSTSPFQTLVSELVQRYQDKEHSRAMERLFSIF